MWRFVMAGSVVLFALNAFLSHELFSLVFLDKMGSIEAAYISLARYMVDHPFEWSWFPLWYGGIPFQNTYPPLLHLLVAGWTWLTGGLTSGTTTVITGEVIDLPRAAALAYHQVTAIFYCLGPVTLFWASTGISKRIWVSFGAALGYSLVSPAIFMVEWMNGLDSIGQPVRLDDLVNFGEGPHVAGVTLLPLALLLVHRAVEKHTAGRIYGAAAGLAAVALTNWLATFALAVTVVVYLIARAGDGVSGEAPAKAEEKKETIEAQVAEQAEAVAEQGEEVVEQTEAVAEQGGAVQEPGEAVVARDIVAEKDAKVEGKAAEKKEQGKQGRKKAKKKWISEEAVRWWFRALGLTICCGILGYALAAPWIPPSTLLDIARNGQRVAGPYQLGATQAVVGIAVFVALIGIAWALRRYKITLMPRVAALMTFALGAIVFSASKLDLAIMPQPERYHLELEVALWILGAFAITTVLDRVPVKIRMMLPAGVGIFVMIQMVSYRDAAEALLNPIDIEDTVEYQIANWLDAEWHPEAQEEEEELNAEIEAQTEETAKGQPKGKAKGKAELSISEEVVPAASYALPGAEAWFLAGNDPEQLAKLLPPPPPPPPEPEEIEEEPEEPAPPPLPIPRGRVFVSGSTRFWLNTFTDTPQSGGGFDQGIINPWQPKFGFGIPYVEGDGEQAVAWLRIFGNEAVVVGGEDTRDAYKDWRDPEKFEDILEELYRDGGDVIYAIPQRTDVPGIPLVDKPDPDLSSDFTPPQETAFLAHVVRPEDVIQIEPSNVEDSAAVEALVKVFDDPEVPAAAFRWEASNRARMYGELAPGDLYYVQIAYHPGWHAYRDGLNAPIVRDALGQMVVEPRCAGPCEVELVFDGGREMLLCQGAMWIVIVGGLVWWAMARRPGASA